MEPEELARRKIDSQLEAAGWVIQNRADFNRNASLGVAVREFALPEGEADYLLFVDGKAAGVVEAKPAGNTLSGVAEQSEKYMGALPAHLATWAPNLIFDYESTGEETFFRDVRDPKPRSRRVFAFHRPDTLLRWLKDDSTLRGRLEILPALETRGLRDCQVEAIHGLEKSLADSRPRSLIQMATGAGKTFTACNFSWRLLKHARATRILFLVDRSNLGNQTLKEFQSFAPPNAAGKFTDIYIAQQLKAARLDPDAKVVIATIQRVYSMLNGKEIDETEEEKSAFETWDNKEGEVAPIAYNPQIPIESFDFIITDECHRSIYGVWRQVLDYFDAFVIGLTATPSKHTLGFFNKNLVAEYPYERSVADGVNVGFEVFRINTEVTQGGGRVEAGFQVPIRDKRSRAVRYQALDADMNYQPTDLDRFVTVPNQIRTVLQAFKDNLFTELFPDRTGEWVPKTLIFAKDDQHAEEIVGIVREVFGQGNDFAKKITYRSTGDDPHTLIRSFRVDPFPRIAVTVDMIATGTDIKPVEVLIFMRDVRSEGYYEQMKGRGVRTIKDSDLHAVTPDAKTKTRFVLIDAVGVDDSMKAASKPLERKRNVSFEALLEQIAQGREDEDAISSLAARLASLERRIDDDAQSRIRDVAEGLNLRDLANALLDCIDTDKIEATAQTLAYTVRDETRAQAQRQLREEALRPFNNPKLRQTLIDIKARADIVIDEITTDQVTNASYDKRHAERKVESFKTFMADNRDELTALQILYNQPYGKQRLTYQAIQDLVTKLADPPHFLTTADVWQAYRRLDQSNVRGAPTDRLLTEIVALVRFALGQTTALESISVQVEQRFNLWIGRQKNAGKEYSEDQLTWLKLIRDHIAANAEIDAMDFQNNPSFSNRGGIVKARGLFGTALPDLLDELSEALVA
jgi:type I restriction enzyme, R subunit